MIRAIPSCMLYTLIIHMDASFVYRGCEPTLLYIGGFYFSTLGNASAYPVHPVSDVGLKNFSLKGTIKILQYSSVKPCYYLPGKKNIPKSGIFFKTCLYISMVYIILLAVSHHPGEACSDTPQE